ncbi:MAG TPA: molybdopterin oxidoreductase [Desulfonauticus sp.]|nr:MAG: Molybdopterin oxidoreductase, transmembrane subunit [Desulfonauticus sp. 38_4375]HCO12290.1 molybdopterin oxidoreductase [Desulfonauticus sp.]
MIDREWLPEGVERCSFGKFAVWLAIIGVVFAWGLYATYRIFANGLIETNLDNYFGFGLWITFDLAVIALGAGAFFSGFLKYIVGIEELKNIINLAVIVGFICYSGTMLILTLDIGQPLRAWFGYWHPNVHSMLTEVIFCITCYCMVLIIEYIPIILENRKLNQNKFIHNLAHNFHVFMPLFAGIGTFLSTFHQGSLGGMYGVLFGRPFAYREGFFIWPWTFFLFVASAIASGPAFTMLIATLMEKITGRKLVSYETKALMGKIAGSLLCFYLFFKFLDTWYWATDTLPRMGLTFDQMFNDVYGKWLLWAELGLCGVIPAILLVVPKFRNIPFLLYTAAILDCIGIVINRFVFTVQTIAFPVMPFDKWYSYVPNWAEWATTFEILAYGALVLSLSYRYLPVFPQEKELN